MCLVLIIRGNPKNPYNLSYIYIYIILFINYRFLFQFCKMKSFKRMFIKQSIRPSDESGCSNDLQRQSNELRRSTQCQTKPENRQQCWENTKG